MCPEESLLSAYVDGEVPSPWKERLDQHIAHCDACRSKIEAYSELKKAFNQDTLIDSDLMRIAVNRVQQRIEERKNTGLHGVQRIMPKPLYFFFNALFARKVEVPLPVLAASLFLMVFFAGLAFGIFGANRQVSQALALSTRLPTPTSANIESMISSIMQPGSTEMITIQAPAAMLKPAVTSAPVYVIYQTGEQRPTITEISGVQPQGADK